MEEISIQTEKQINAAQALQRIADLVRLSAVQVAEGLLAAAKQGQLAPAKYLFELAGIYPGNEESEAASEESLTYTLLRKLGLPTEPGSEVGSQQADVQVGERGPSTRM